MTVVGGDSCSAIIQLGQYFGYPVQETADSLEVVQKQHSDLFCRFLLASDRLAQSETTTTRLQLSTKSKMHVSILNKNTKKEIVLSSYFQMCLNILSNHYNSQMGDLLDTKDLENLIPVKESTFSSQQWQLSCMLKALSQYIATGQEKGVEVQKHLLSKTQFIDLFSNLCVYGDSNIQELATQNLFHLCANTDWWEDGLIEIYKQYFSFTPVVPIPKKRYACWLVLLEFKIVTLLRKLNHVVIQSFNSQ